MKIGLHVETAKNIGTDGALPDRFYQDCMKLLGGRGTDAALIMNDRGEVLYCNEEGASVFACEPAALAGKHLSDFVLNIRLNRWTPGGNVAYASFSGSRNQWREHCMLDSTGRSFVAEVQLDVIVVNLRYLIPLWIRPLAERTAKAPELAISPVLSSDSELSEQCVAG